MSTRVCRSNHVEDEEVMQSKTNTKTAEPSKPRSPIPEVQRKSNPFPNPKFDSLVIKIERKRKPK